MRKLILLLLLPGVIYAQTHAPNKGTEKYSEITGVTGTNTIIVVQGNGNRLEYNMLDKKQAYLFLDYLKTIPNINKLINQILQSGKKTFDLVTKIYQKTNDEGIFNTDNFLKN